MFERYTEKARRTIFFARYEASAFGSVCIETEHILLGLLREEKALFFRLLGNVRYNDIHGEVARHTVIREKVPTSVDLPLSDESKRVLVFAAEEAERLNHRHIGTEHLLLGLLREKKDPAAQLLLQRGADLEKLRLEVGKPSPSSTFTTHSVPARGFSPAAKSTIAIHDIAWNADYIRDLVARHRGPAWHWSKAPWIARDIVSERNGGSISFDLRLAADPAKFEIVKGGCKKDHCAVCHWELFETKEDAAHGTGYSNGREWLCVECYEKFFRGPDFFGSSYSEIT